MRSTIILLFCLLSAPLFSQQFSDELKAMKGSLRDALKLQLPNTEPETRKGLETRKGYSFDFSRDAPVPTWEIPEKYYLASNDSLIGGAKCYLPVEAIDPGGIQMVYSEDSTRIALVLRAKPGASFMFHPYSSEPDSALAELRLGWYERVQALTLNRIIASMRELLGKFGN